MSRSSRYRYQILLARYGEAVTFSVRYKRFPYRTILYLSYVCLHLLGTHPALDQSTTIIIMSAQRLSVISSESLDFLRGLQVDGTVENNHRRIRRGVLRDSSDDQTWSEELILPVYFESIEALRFIGLQKNAAQSVLQHFNVEYNEPSTTLHAYDLIEFASKVISMASPTQSLLKMTGLPSSRTSVLKDHFEKPYAIRNTTTSDSRKVHENGQKRHSRTHGLF